MRACWVRRCCGGVAIATFAFTAACVDPDSETGRFVSGALSASSAEASPPRNLERGMPTAAAPSAAPAAPQALPTVPDREKLQGWLASSSVEFPKGMRIRINAQYRDLTGRHRIAIESADCPIGPPAEADPECPWAGLRMAAREEPNGHHLSSAIRSCLSLATVKLEHPKERKLTVVFERPPRDNLDPLDPDFGYNEVTGSSSSFLCLLE